MLQFFTVSKVSIVQLAVGYMFFCSTKSTLGIIIIHELRTPHRDQPLIYKRGKLENPRSPWRHGRSKQA